VLFPLRGRCAARSGLSGKQHLWFAAVPSFEPFRGCPRNAKLSAQFGKQAGRGRRKPLPRKKPLNETSGKTGFAIYQIPLISGL